MKKKMIQFICSLFLFCLSAPGVFGQVREVSGKITDQSTGGPMAGVTVTVKGSSVSVTTDAGGIFLIRVPSEKVTLQFTYVGYEPVELKPGKGSMTVALKKADKSLDDVVVVGYGTVKKRDLTGAVSVVKANDIVRSPTNNPLEAIQGMVAGADIVRSSGKANASDTLLIRGTRSINGSSAPLVIIDGIQGGSIATMNPNDIETIEVLKDASATAIYGSQGANGVIIVTTKKGTSGKVRVNYNGYYGRDGYVQYPQPRMGQSYIDLRRTANANVGSWHSPKDDSTIFNSGELAAIGANQWVNWVDLVTNNGTRQSHSLSVSGGSEKSKAYLSVGYYGDNGMIKFNNLHQYNALLNLDQELAPWIKTGVQAGLVYSNANTRSGDPYSLGETAVPLGTPYDANGNVVVYPIAGYSGVMSPLSDDRGPLIATNNSISTRSTFNIHLDIQPMKDLTFKTIFGANLTSSRSGQYFDSSSLEEINNKLNVADVTTENVRFYDWDNVLTYNKQIGEHSFKVTGVTSYTAKFDETYYAYGTGLIYSSQLFYNLAGTSAAGRIITSSYVQTNNMSYAGRINYSYKGRYLFEATERVDGASLLSANRKWAAFPSASVAWRLSDEKFLQDINAISNLKVRFGYGVTGNSGILPYGTQSVLQVQPMGFENTPASAYIFSPLLGNANVQWELSKTANLGFDMGFFKDRIDATVDLYNTNTSRILMLRPVPASLGVSNTYQNVGSSRNRGIEVTLNTRNVDGRNFKWLSTVNFASNQEKITGLLGGTNIIGNPVETGSLLLGRPIHSFYSYRKLGIWQIGDSSKAAALTYGGTPFKPGDIKIADINHDGKISSDSDYTYIGNAEPKWALGFQNTFLYKGFDLTVLTIVRWGQMIQAKFLGRYDPTGHSNSPGYFNYWTTTNPTNDFPAPNAGKALTAMPGYQGLLYVDGSYWKIKTATLGYTFPQQLMRRAFMSSLRAYITCNNIFVKAKNHLIKDYDPERGGAEDSPMSRQLVVGLNVGF